MLSYLLCGRAWGDETMGENNSNSTEAEFPRGKMRQETTRISNVVADDRERASGVLEHLASHHSLKLTVRRLELGDYLVDNRILFERKTIADFSASIVDGRLFAQACRMAESSFHPVFLIEGSVKGNNMSGVNREAIQGSVITLSLFLNIPCFRSFDVRETANLIRYTGQQLQRNRNGGVYRHGYRPKRRRNRQLFVLQGLPGIGPARAERLLEKFGSIEAVFCADAEALSRVKGLGRRTAEAIRDLVGPDVSSIQDRN